MIRIQKIILPILFYYAEDIIETKILSILLFYYNRYLVEIVENRNMKKEIIIFP